MYWTVLTALAAALLLLIVKDSEHHNESKSTLYKAVKYLWNQQGTDGGWHSKTHTILASGESLTPFILNALLEVPDSVYPVNPERVARAFAFIRNGVQGKIQYDKCSIRSNGLNGLNRLRTPRILDYPNYTAAYTLRVLVRHGDTEDSVLVNCLTEYLAEQQFTEERGISPQDPAYGGWGFGETNLPYGASGHVDISHTRRILQSLRLVLPTDNTVFSNAEKYFAHVQNMPGTNHAESTAWQDGGFFTSLVAQETNKSRKVAGAEAWESYATATCDGLLGLIAAGLAPDDKRIVAAVQWLFEHQQLQYPEGIPMDDPMQWHRVMKYYHLAVRGEVCATGWCMESVRTGIRELLHDEQREDGSFINPEGEPNKENDPLLCTAFAILALTGTQVSQQML